MPARTASSHRPLTVRIARWSAGHPWRAIAMWVVFVSCCIAVGPAVGVHTLSDLDTGVGQSGRAERILHDAGLRDPAAEDVLITSPRGPLDAALARRAAVTVTDRMAALPGVAAVAEPVRSAGRGAVLVDVTVRGDPATAPDRVDALLDATRAVQADYPALRVEQVGAASLDNAVNEQVGRDLGAAARYSVPLTLLVLLVAFGAIIAAGVPVLLALSAVGSAIGLSAVASLFVPDSGTTSSLILLIGMAVGVDYSLFYVKRVREEQALGRTRLDAIDIAAETSGHSVLVSGLAVIVAMLGLLVADDAVFDSLATGSIIVVAVAVLGSLTVLPALLATLGGHLDRPRVPVLWRLSASGPAREPRLWARVLRPTLAHPARTLTASMLLLLVLAAPALGLTLHSDSPQSLPASIPAVGTLNRLTAAFPQQNSTDVVVVSAPTGRGAAVLAGLRALRSRVGEPLFVAAQPAIRTSRDGTVHELALSVPFDSESPQARQGLTLLRTRLLPHTVGTVPGVSWAVGGDPAVNVDYDHHLASRMPWVIGFVVLMTMLMVAVIFRSVVLALVTAFVNLLSAGAAFGVLTLTFQHTWAQGLLRFRSSGAVITWVPLFTFAVLFGLSMDYHVFVISRTREAAATGLDTRAAVRVGITRSAGTVSSAAVVMVVVFGIFALLHLIEMKEIGVGLAVAVLVDAVVVRAVVLPALLTLLGPLTWWPGRPDRRRVARPERAARELVGQH